MKKMPQPIADISMLELDELWLAIDSAKSRANTPSSVAIVLETIESPLRTRNTTKAKSASSRTLSPEDLELRRKSNSASMRRASQRKKLEFQHMREQSSQPRRTELDVREQLHLIKMYQHEQLCLHNAIQRQEKVAASLSQLIDASKSLVFGNTSIYSGVHQLDEDFLWVNTVLPFLPAFSKAQVNDLVRESYLEISRYFAHAEALPPSPHTVLGWSDRQCVADDWADFVFGKDFPNEAIETLTARTWDNYVSTEKNVRLREATYKVLERLDDNTLFMAKNLRSHGERGYHHSLFLVIRVRTANGYIIANRSLSPLPQYKQRFMDALGGSYILQYYGMSFSRLDAQPGRGCSVKMFGHVGNYTPGLAQVLATMAVVILLNWESRCVQPLRLLPSTE
ncbi:hypothetical protein PybrP1_003582 [[Pythium] brassicae (nom. inval.)]|nr:hypothetical protein PybrP1_003582 [[Pythium] brassicae (nom. inval.)]